MNFVTLVNLFFVWFCWKESNHYFNDKKNFSGWVFIFLSALNFVAVAMVVTR